MTDEPPPLPRPDPAPPRRESRRWPVYVLFAALIIGAILGNLVVEVRFLDDAGSVPGAFEVTLKSDDSEQKTTVEGGRLKIRRGRWKEIEITDDFYVRSSEKIHGRNMWVTIERNELLKLKQASNGQPSVPQGNDPDPRHDDR